MGGPIPLHRYRPFKATKTQQRVDRVETLAAQVTLPRAALEDAGGPLLLMPDLSTPAMVPFVDPDPFQEFTFPTAMAAKRAVADELAMPLAKLSRDQMEALDALLTRTLRKTEVLAYIRTQPKPCYQG
jgi:hypothetical protein